MNTDGLLQKAKSQLTLKHPYFGMLASRLKHESSEKVRTYASNGTRFIYNPEFISGCSIDETMFILTHCVMHHILAHQQRQLKRKGTLWQLATDFAINNMLYENGLTIPAGANLNEAFKGMYAEEIYTLLKEEYDIRTDDAFDGESGQDKNNHPPGDPGIDDAHPSDDSFSNLNNIEDDLDAQTESQWHYAASVSWEMVQRKSAMPSGLDRLAQKVKANNVDWRFVLYNAINRHMRNNYAFMPPNKKHLHRGFILPSLTSDTLSLCVAIDTSGSINDVLLGVFLEEFKSIMQNFPAVQIELIIADAKVHAHHTFRGGEKMDFPLKGGGGTDYRPVFDYIDAKLPLTTMLLYFTDGDGWFPRRTPNYEVLWALSAERKVPFGKKLVLFV